MPGKIERSFYLREDVVAIARDLVGKHLFTRYDGHLTGGMISETEAYNGIVDRASHAYNGRRTGRTEVMFREGGVAYIYLCYGIHSLFNIVTNRSGVPHAVLIRAIVPTHGVALMLDRCGRKKRERDFGYGPGIVSRALGIHYSDTGTDLLGDRIWLEDRSPGIDGRDIQMNKRIGVDYAGEDADLPYRFTLSGTGKKE